MIDDDGVTVPAPCQWDGRALFAGNYADYKPFNFVDGEGVRCSLYVSGCPFRCPNCYNRATQSFRYGQPYTDELEERILAENVDGSHKNELINNHRWKEVLEV
ncbi:4Fe-4S cluster-binding domain-containing protein [Trueperella abortisuis]|uniref:Pyruvate-formate lyase-activating enzyme n=1 Tax=Trueperella abortisuis TaxID=445930 RepID=A0ABT9PG34_9ACTO|nr:4Fe-4S cluster-binding domain-containing protein [Trueperella abortisuis]MDP9831451.1 pyruvate-formate lyase-activating enzyme [Trueperella abortisuis]